MRFESTTDVAAPTGKIWALIDKLEDWPQWMPSIKNIKRMSMGPLAIGSRLSVTANVSGIRVTLLMTITEFVPERKVVMVGRALGTRLTRFYKLQPVSDKTKIMVGGEVSGVLAPLARWGGQRVSDEIVLVVKKMVETVEP
jgi:carbon monoxide dehydrogenase subunit G